LYIDPLYNRRTKRSPTSNRKNHMQLCQNCMWVWKSYRQ